MRIQKNISGFTLLELLLAIGIVCAVCVASFPMWSHWVEKSRLETTSNELMRLLKFSRQTAVVKKERIIICPSIDNKSCHDNWSAPYVIALNSAGVMRRVELQRVRVQWQGNLGLNKRLVFEPTGMTAGQQGSFVIGLDKRITVLMSGAMYYR